MNIQKNDKTIVITNYTPEEEKKIEELWGCCGKEVWKPKTGETIFYLEDIDIVKDKWSNSDYDENCYLMDLVFQTEQEAIKERDLRLAIARVKRKKTELGLDFEPDWKNEEQRKWNIKYSTKEKKFIVDYYWGIKEYTPLGHFENREDAENIFKECEEDLKIIWDVN